jgi:transcriptional regulator with XRE-family HTH domain
MGFGRDVQRFLTEMRSRLTPDEAGVTVFGGERRVPGLRREEVAQLAGVSTAYYTRMERRNLRGVSEGVLRSLARTLRMDDAETQHLFALAHAASEGAGTRRRKPRPVRLPQRAAQLIDTMPDVPAVALDRLGDVLAANALGRALFPDNAQPLNLARYFFRDDRAREFYVDWEREARHVVSAMRLIASRDPSDPAPDVQIVTYPADPGSPSADALDLLRSWTATTHAAHDDHSPHTTRAHGDSQRRGTFNP